LLPDVHFIRLNHTEDLQQIDHQTACVILETIQGDAGVRIPDWKYLQALRAQCLETGTQLILDEIQCGVGRTGTFFAFEQYGIVPDILTCGKALGGGMPVGCMVSSKEKMQLFTHHPMLGHISTFAGHPVICAAVEANIEYLKAHNIVAEVEKKGQKIANFLRSHRQVKEIRQRGLFFAIDMESAEAVKKVVEYCLEHGVITFWFLSCPWSFRIAPPLIISESEIEESCSVIMEAFDLL
jgi:acetylornithine/succinyldiaminopimelate/putrescine aminotransferase